MTRIAKPMQLFEKYAYPEPNTGCWLWGGTNLMAYGAMYFEGKQRYAHRVSYSLFKGPVPEGMSVLHKCDTPMCVNPDHLYLGTQQDNMKDKLVRGRNIYGLQHHKRKLTPEAINDILRLPTNDF